MMFSLRIVLAITFFFFCFIEYGETIMCYQCADSKAGDECETNFDLMKSVYLKYNESGTNLTDAEIIQTKFLKKCQGFSTFGSWGNGNYCVILEIKTQDKTAAFIRDCSDGLTFPVAGSRNYFPISTDNKPVPADNQTVCGYAATGNPGLLVCLSLCTTDLCNGPQYVQDTGVNLLTNPHLLLITFLCSYTVNRSFIAT